MKFILKDVIDKDVNYKHLLFWCPGCDLLHAITVAGNKEPKWVFDGNIIIPTCSPSILVRGNIICHSFLVNGKLNFYSDSQHDFAGKDRVDVPELPDWVIS